MLKTFQEIVTTEVLEKWDMVTFYQLVNDNTVIAKKDNKGGATEAKPPGRPIVSGINLIFYPLAIHVDSL